MASLTSFQPRWLNEEQSSVSAPLSVLVEEPLDNRSSSVCPLHCVQTDGLAAMVLAVLLLSLGAESCQS